MTPPNAPRGRRPRFVGPWRIWHVIENGVAVRPHWAREYVVEDGHKDCCAHTEFLRGPSLA